MKSTIFKKPPDKIPGPQTSVAKTATVDDGFQIVKRKQRRKPPTIGVNKSSEAKINIMKKKYVCLFMSRLSPDCTCDEVESFVTQTLNEKSLSCAKLQTRFPGHSSFKIEMHVDGDKNVFDPEIWPDGLLVRRYFIKKRRKKVTMNHVSIASFNCKGMRSSEYEIKELCSTKDIICLQEIWLDKSELSLFNTFDPSFSGTGVSPVDPTDGLLVGRKYGGVGFLWNKRLQHCIKPLKFPHNWLTGINVSLENSSLTILGVYLPYNSLDNVDSFLQCIGFLQSVIEDLQTGYYMIIGDFNTEPKSSSTFNTILTDFITESGMVLIDHDLLPPDSYTFVSTAWQSTSWLDHCICSASLKPLISHMEIGYKFVSSDHKPLMFCLNVKTNKSSDNNFGKPAIKPVINWSNISQDNIQAYHEYSNRLLEEINLPKEALACRQMNCVNDNHTNLLTTFYRDIVAALTTASDNCLVKPGSSYNQKKHSIPGWNYHLKEFHMAARDAFLLWRQNGSPRTGTLAYMMRKSRALFKYLVRRCRKDHLQHRADSMANSLMNSGGQNSAHFWKKIKNDTNSKVPLPDTLEGVTGTENIANFWKEHYRAIFNSVKPDSFTVKNLDHMQFDSTVLVDPEIVQSIIEKLSTGKSCGPDGLSTEHYKYCGRRINHLLALLFTSLFVHGYIPSEMIESVLVPIIKNKAGDLADKSNYRPIGISSVCSKILEKIILDRLEKYAVITDNQFGFKRCHSTESCIFLLKEILHYFKRHDTTSFLCFMDAIKALTE